MTEPTVVLTGIKPTGRLHLGNYVGALRPTLRYAQQENTRTFCFVADYHALTAMRDAELLAELCTDLAATWISCGLNLDRAILYRQSDVPEVFELSWVLSCFTAKGLMNRAHAYKAAVQKNEEKGEPDLDAGVNMGLYNYPVLMAADILLCRPHLVPVGKDQIQHLEIATDLAERFNSTYGKPVLRLPKAIKEEHAAAIPGLDGRKMSKSYDNTVMLIETPEATLKRVKKFVTDSSDPKAPKDPDASSLFALYREFATADEVGQMRRRFQEGIGWGTVKEEVAGVINRELAEPRRRYAELRKDTAALQAILDQGAEQARQVARRTLADVRDAIGIRPATAR